MNYINAKSNTYPFVEVVIYSENVRRSICAVNQSRFSRQEYGYGPRRCYTDTGHEDGYLDESTLVDDGSGDF